MIDLEPALPSAEGASSHGALAHRGCRDGEKTLLFEPSLPRAFAFYSGNLTRRISLERRWRCARRRLELATEPEQVIQSEAQLEAIEGYMRATGLYSTEEIRPVNE